MKRPNVSVTANSKRTVRKANWFTKDIMVLNQCKNNVSPLLLPLNFVVQRQQYFGER